MTKVCYKLSSLTQANLTVLQIDGTISVVCKGKAIISSRSRTRTGPVFRFLGTEPDWRMVLRSKDAENDLKVIEKRPALYREFHRTS